jgi:ketosteroid isomerase-like protein
VNVEIVQAIYDAWERGERPGPAELLDPEIEYVNPAGAVEPGTRRGLASFARAVERTREGWDAWDMQLERLEEAGDRAAALVHYRARGRGSGIELEGRESALWTIRDGKVVRYEWFHDPEDAFDELGRTSDAKPL